jgi:PAS domain S-box-containing protein
MRIENSEICNANLFEVILDHFPDIIHSVDVLGNIVFANKVTAKILGYSMEEYLRLNIRDLYPPEILDDLSKGFETLKKTGSNAVESVILDKAGNRIPVEIRSFSIYDDEGNFVRTFSNLRDLREVKGLQQSLIHAERLAAIGELASGIAHDINNPLAVIQMSLQCALNEFGDEEDDAVVDEIPDETRLHLEAMRRAAKSISNLVTHLRDFSRGVTERKEIIDLGRVIEDALFITQSRTQKRRITVNNLAERGRYFASGCPNQIEQIFANLISNASDAMEDCEVRELSISIEAQLNDDVEYLECVFTDTGNGIPEDVRETVFESFYTTKEKGKGTGLGLSIVRGIVHDHDGSIDFDSAHGSGTTFHVRLPRVAPPQICDRRSETVVQADTTLTR